MSAYTGSHNTLELVPAISLPLGNLGALINAVYADYYIPIRMHSEQLQEMFVEEDIDLSKSTVAIAAGEPAGLAFLSVRGREGWVSGVGVLPQYRRQGVARCVLQQIQKNARQAGLHTLCLEVLTQNEAGAALYQQLGFQKMRDLLVLRTEAGRYELAAWPAHIQPVTLPDVLPYYAAFHDEPVPWQRALRSLQNRASKLRGLGYWQEARLVGYLLYEILPDNHAIYDLAVTPAHPERLRIAEALLHALHTYRTDIGSYIINLPTEDPLAAAFTNLRYRIWQRQHEMVWGVNPR